MDKKLWLTHEIVFQKEKPNKKVYTITDLGRQELETWLALIDKREAENIRSSFLMKVFFSGEKELKDNIEMLRIYRITCQKHLDMLKEADNKSKYYSEIVNDHNKSMYWKATSMYGEYYYKMCIQWVDDVIQMVEKDSL